MQDDIRIVEYDPNWPAKFTREKERILAACYDIIRGIEHVGSTAVPNLAAKPVIDILIGVDDLSAVSKEHIERLERLGYEYCGEAGISGRLFFKKGLPRTHHLHVAKYQGDFWKKHLLFRDYLRAHPEAVKEYEELKRKLSKEFQYDREKYTTSKSPLIGKILKRALKWQKGR